MIFASFGLFFDARLSDSSHLPLEIIRQKNVNFLFTGSLSALIKDLSMIPGAVKPYIQEDQK